jgi:hypothetical protein
MTYLVLGLVVLIIGFVIENVLRGPVKASRTGNQAGDGGHGSDGGGGGG